MWEENINGLMFGGSSENIPLAVMIDQSAIEVILVALQA